MKYRVLSLPFDPETGFDDAELVALCADHEVVQMREHWFEHGDRPWLGLLLSFHDDERPRRQAGQREERKASRDPRRGLSPEERARYDTLREWRSMRASADGVPPYLVFNNQQLAEIARRRPTTRAALLEIEGVGDGKLNSDAWKTRVGIRLAQGERG